MSDTAVGFKGVLDRAGCTIDAGSVFNIAAAFVELPADKIDLLSR
jgi:hypothetical protein